MNLPSDVQGVEGRGSEEGMGEGEEEGEVVEEWGSVIYVGVGIV